MTKTWDQCLAEARDKATNRRVLPRQHRAGEGMDEWTAQLAVTNAAVRQLWALVSDTRDTDYHREQLLWRKHYEELWRMKRLLDAAVM